MILTAFFGCCGERKARLRGPYTFRLRITAPHWSAVAMQRVASRFTKARVVCLTGVRVELLLFVFDLNRHLFLNSPFQWSLR